MDPHEIITKYILLQKICARYDIPFEYSSKVFKIAGRGYSDLDKALCFVDGIVCGADYEEDSEPKGDRLDGNDNSHNPNDHSTKITTKKI